MRVHADKSQKIKDDVEKFWKTRTDAIYSLHKKDQEEGERNSSMRRKYRLSPRLKVHT